MVRIAHVGVKDIKIGKLIADGFTSSDGLESHHSQLPCT